jgi:putative transposon-encoded protein
MIIEKTVTKFGNGAKIDAPKELLGKKVYVIVRK